MQTARRASILMAFFLAGNACGPEADEEGSDTRPTIERPNAPKPPTVEERLEAVEAKLETQAKIIAAAEKLLGVIVVSDDEVEFRGVNVRVTNGPPGTMRWQAVGDDLEGVNGRGNLLIGPKFNSDKIKGSHNLVLGYGHNVSSYGAFVGGTGNESSAPFASVLGGENNSAHGHSSTILGGNSVETCENCLLSVAAGDHLSAAKAYKLYLSEIFTPSRFDANIELAPVYHRKD